MRAPIVALGGALLLTLAVTAGTRGYAAPVAHTALESSSPSANDTLRTAPDRIELTFTGLIEGTSSEISLSSGSGVAIPIEIAFDPAEPRVVRGLVQADLGAGGYRVEWRTIAADGHAANGTFVFFLDLPASEGAAGASMAPLEAPPPSSQEPEEPPLPSLAALLRAAAVAALAGLTGLLVLGVRVPLASGARIERLALVLAWAAPILLLAHAAAWFRYVTASFDGITPVDIFAYNLPGQVESARIALALLALWAVALARRPGLGAAFAAGAVVVSGFMGHSMAFVPEILVPARIIHVGALAVWLGGLLILVATSRRGAEFQGLARVVSTGALAAVVLLLITGVAHLFLYPGSILGLVGSRYATALIAKLVGLGILIVLGARNRLRLVRRLPDERAGAALRRTVAWEIAIMAGVLVATGALAYLPVPEPAVEMTAELTAVPQ